MGRKSREPVTPAKRPGAADAAGADQFDASTSVKTIKSRMDALPREASKNMGSFYTMMAAGLQRETDLQAERSRLREHIVRTMSEGEQLQNELTVVAESIAAAERNLESETAKLAQLRHEQADSETRALSRQKVSRLGRRRCLFCFGLLLLVLWIVATLAYSRGGFRIRDFRIVREVVRDVRLV